MEVSGGIAYPSQIAPLPKVVNFGFQKEEAYLTGIDHDMNGLQYFGTTNPEILIRSNRQIFYEWNQRKNQCPAITQSGILYVIYYF